MGPRGSTKSSRHRRVACGRRRVTRLMRQAGLEGRCKKRWRKTTVADPDAEAAKDLIQRHFGPCDRDRPPLRRRHHLHRDLGGLGLPGHRHRPGQPQGRRLGAGRPHAHRAGRRRAHAWPSPTERPDDGVIFHSDRGCQYTSRDFADLARANGVVLSVGRKGECWDNAVAESFFATIKRELIDTRSWPTSAGLRPRRLRLHRGLVQHPPAALLARLPQPRPVRSSPPQRRPSGGMINTSNLSVKPDQAHLWRMATDSICPAGMGSRWSHCTPQGTHGGPRSMW